jgi:hypothetical protein
VACGGEPDSRRRPDDSGDPIFGGPVSKPSEPSGGFRTIRRLGPEFRRIGALNQRSGDRRPIVEDRGRPGESVTRVCNPAESRRPGTRETPVCPVVFSDGFPVTISGSSGRESGYFQWYFFGEFLSLKQKFLINSI